MWHQSWPDDDFVLAWVTSEGEGVVAILNARQHAGGMYVGWMRLCATSHRHR